MVTPVRRLVGLVLAAVAALSLTASTADASHFQGGTVYWERDLTFVHEGLGRYTVTFDVTYRWGGSPWEWIPVRPQVGDTLQEPRETWTLNSGNFDRSGTLTPVVIYVDPNRNLMIARSSFTIDIPFLSGRATVVMQNSARAETILEGNGNIDYRLQAIIDPTKGTRSPRIYAPLRITIPRNTAFTGLLLGEAFDGFTNLWSFAPLAESRLQRQVPCGSPFSVSAPCAQPMMLSPTGVLSWTPTIAGQYAVQFKATSTNALGVSQLSTPFDVVFEVIDLSPVTPRVTIVPSIPSSNAVITVDVNDPLSFTALLTPAGSATSGYTVSPVLHNALPSGVIATSSSGPGLQSQVTFTSDAPRSFPICLSATATRTGAPDYNSLGLNCYTVNVVAAPPVLTCAAPLTLNTNTSIDASGVRYVAAPPATTVVYPTESGPLSVVWRLLGPLFFADGQLRTDYTYPPTNISAPQPTQPVTLDNFAFLRKGAYTLSTLAAHGGVPPVGSCDMAITVLGDAQTVTFPPVGPLVAGGPPVALAATAPGGPVEYTVVSGPGSIAPGSNLLHAHAVGTIEVRATQPGNATYEPASTNQFVSVTAALTSLTAPLIIGDTFAGSTITVTSTLTRTSAPAGALNGIAVVFTLIGAASNPDGPSAVTQTATTAPDGTATTSFSLGSRGSFTLTAAFAGSSSLVPAQSQAPAISVLQRTRLVATDATGAAGAPVALRATLVAVPQLTPIAFQTVSFSSGAINGVAATDATGLATVSQVFSTAGTFTTTAAFANLADFFVDENGTPIPTTGSATTVVTLATTALTQPVLPPHGFVAAPLTVASSLTRVTAPAGSVPTAPVRFALSGPGGLAADLIQDTDAAGVATVTVTPLERGPHTIVATFTGNAGLAGTTSTIATSAIYQRARLTLTVPPGGVAGADQAISARLSTVPGDQPIANQVIQLTFGGSLPAQSVMTDQDGNASVAVNFPSASPYAVAAAFENLAGHFANATGSLAAEAASATINVVAATTALTAPTAPATANVGDTVTVTTLLSRVDAPAGPLPLATVTLRVVDPNGVATDHPLTSDTNGAVTASVQASLRGVYALSFAYAGSSGLGAAASATHQLVVRQPTVLTLSSVGATAGAPVTITATLRTSQGAPVPNQAVTISIGGLPQSLTTGGDGTASVLTTIARAGAHAVSASFSNAAAFFGEASAATTLTLADPTAPTVTPVVTGTLLPNGWYTSDVLVTWQVADPESDPTTCAASAIANDGAAITVSCQSTSAGGSTTASVTIKRDTTAPQLVLPPNQSAIAPTATGIAVNYPVATATDLSGIAGVSCSPASGAIFPVGATPVTCTATDNTGHVTTGGFTVTVTLPVVDDDVPGRMFGDGRAPAPNSHTIEFDFSVVETRRREDGKVDIVVRDGRRRKGDDERFRAKSADDVIFSNSPEYDPGRRQNMRVDTVIFRGTGKWEGKNGYSYEVRASDRGEWGRGRDTFTIEIRSANGTVVFSGGGVLTGGNVESVRVPGRTTRDWR